LHYDTDIEYVERILMNNDIEIVVSPKNTKKSSYNKRKYR